MLSFLKKTISSFGLSINPTFTSISVIVLLQILHIKNSICDHLSAYTELFSLNQCKEDLLFKINSIQKKFNLNCEDTVNMQFDSNFDTLFSIDNIFNVFLILYFIIFFSVIILYIYRAIIWSLPYIFKNNISNKYINNLILYIRTYFANPKVQAWLFCTLIFELTNLLIKSFFVYAINITQNQIFSMRDVYNFMLREYSKVEIPSIIIPVTDPWWLSSSLFFGIIIVFFVRKNYDLLYKIFIQKVSSDIRIENIPLNMEKVRLSPSTEELEILLKQFQKFNSIDVKNPRLLGEFIESILGSEPLLQGIRNINPILNEMFESKFDQGYTIAYLQLMMWINGVLKEFSEKGGPPISVFIRETVTEFWNNRKK